MSRQAFMASLEGEQLGPIDLEEVDILTTLPACTLSWMPYTSGATIPSGVVIGGHLADETFVHIYTIAPEPVKQPWGICIWINHMITE